LNDSLVADEFVARSIPKEAHKLRGKALVDYVNKQQPFFKAEYSPLFELRMRSLMKTEFLQKPRSFKIKARTNKSVINANIPESFDARDKWKNCPSIGYIRDQSNCGTGPLQQTQTSVSRKMEIVKKLQGMLKSVFIGSCWAVSAAETMSDRICIQSRGRVKGVCKPYPFHPCGHHLNQTFYGFCPKDRLYRTPTCKQYCQYGYGKRYKNDKIYAKSADFVDGGEVAIQEEIIRNGPVQAGFIVYEDFSHYKNGIYVVRSRFHIQLISENDPI
uniref:Pept_C1 domain-containing protein n=1 Tax=Haemonchus placei TaxID=6290 RepID=A0A0N4X7C3_HAEPC